MYSNGSRIKYITPWPFSTCTVRAMASAISASSRRKGIRLPLLNMRGVFVSQVSMTFARADETSPASRSRWAMRKRRTGGQRPKTIERYCASMYKPTAALSPSPPLIGTVAMWWKRRSSRVKCFSPLSSRRSTRSVRKRSALRSRQSASRRISPASWFFAASAAAKATSQAVPVAAACRSRNWPSIRSAFVQSGLPARAVHCGVSAQICFRNWKRAQSAARSCSNSMRLVLSFRRSGSSSGRLVNVTVSVGSKSVSAKLRSNDASRLARRIINASTSSRSFVQYFQRWSAMAV